MTDNTKPISASNPPASRGTRGAAEDVVVAGSRDSKKKIAKEEQVVYGGTEKEKSPATPRKITDK